MSGQDNQKPRYSTLHYGVRADLDITWAEYILLDMVYHLSGKFGYCSKSQSNIAADMGITRMGVHKIVKRLLERELIIKVDGGLMCSAAYLDIAYLEKDVNKVSERKQSLQKPRKQSLSDVNKVSKVYQKFTNNRGENNNRITIETNSISTDVDILGDHKEQVSKIYYQIIKTLDLPKGNNNNIRTWINELAAHTEKDKIIKYLTFLRDQYLDTDWDFKPQITEPYHILSKRAQIRATFAKAVKDQQNRKVFRI